MDIPHAHVVLHLAMLAGVIVATTFLVVRYRGYRPYLLTELGKTLLPYVVLGGLCCCLLSGNGIPGTEWVLPALCAVILTAFCGDHAVISAARWWLFASSIVLCYDFMIIMGGGSDYTAHPPWIQRISRGQTHASLSTAADYLREKLPADALVPEGPLHVALKEPAWAKVPMMFAEREWHTGVSRLYRVRRSFGYIWCPAGRVDEVSERLEVRPLEAQ